MLRPPRAVDFEVLERPAVRETQIAGVMLEADAYPPWCDLCLATYGGE